MLYHEKCAAEEANKILKSLHWHSCVFHNTDCKRSVPSESHPRRQLRFKDQTRLCSSAWPSERHPKEFLSLLQTTDSSMMYRKPTVGEYTAAPTLASLSRLIPEGKWHWGEVMCQQESDCALVSVLTLDFTDRPHSWTTSWLTDYTELWTGETHSQFQTDSQTAQYLFFF